jgi:SRSO17 transposase
LGWPRPADQAQYADGGLARFTTWCPTGSPIATVVTVVEGCRWAIEDSFETAKNEFGLDHNETRSWHGWHRHGSLVMLAFAMMAAIQHQTNKSMPKKQAAPPHPLFDPGDPTRERTASRANASILATSSHGRSGGVHIRPLHKSLTPGENHHC